MLPEQKSLRWWLVGFTVLSVLLFDGLVAINLWRERNTRVAEAQQHAIRMAQTLHRQIEEATAGIDKLLSGLAEIIATRLDKRTQPDSEISGILLRRLAFSPYSRALLVLDVSGHVVSDTNVQATPNRNLSDRIYFTVHRDDPHAGLYVGSLVKSRETGQMFIPMSRRLVSAKGEFVGVVLAIVDPSALRTLFEHADVSQSTAVALLHHDGSVLAVHPEPHDGGVLSAQTWPLAGEYRGGRQLRGREDIWPLSGQNRYLGFCATPHYPLAILVAVDPQPVLKFWQENFVTSGIVALGTTTLIAALAVLFLRQLIRQDQTLSALHASEAALRQAVVAAEIAHHAKTQFLANMSHELRTPLNAVIGFSEALLARIAGALNEKQRDYVRDIHNSGQHLLTLISDILDLSRIEAGRFELQEEFIDIRVCISISIAQIKPGADKKNLDIRTYVAPSIEKIIGDRRAMQQIIYNILSNSVKFTPDQGEITIVADINAEGNVRLALRDTGIGIPAHELPLVTQPFHQVESAFSRRFDGSGLGLSLAKALVDMQGGTFSIASTLGVGTEVIIVFPAFRLADTSEKPEEKPEKPSNEQRETTVRANEKVTIAVAAVSADKSSQSG